MRFKDQQCILCYIFLLCRMVVDSFWNSAQVVGREVISGEYMFPFFTCNSGFYCAERGFETTEEYVCSEHKSTALNPCLLPREACLYSVS
jgi:hypothetical protein